MNEIKILILGIGLLLAGLPGAAQVLKPADWTYYTSQEEVEIGQEIELFFDAELDKSWFMYASDIDPGLGPVPASFSFEPHESYELLGKIESVQPTQKYDPLWEGDVRFFEGQALFRQRIRVLAENPQIQGTHRYQLCSRRDGRCIMEEADFVFNQLKVKPRPPGRQQPEKRVRQEKAAGRHKALPLPAAPADTAGTRERPAVEQQEAGGEALQEQESLRLTNPQEDAAPADAAPADTAAEEGLWHFALLAFMAGLAALLTPCVFPVIPLTVSWFAFERAPAAGGKAGPGKPLLYGFSIIAIYTVAGTLLAWLNGPAFANWLSTHWLPNLLFFGVFTLFGLSFLGLFEIRLPASWINRADRQADKGGSLGVFFMAFTLVLVSFSCTGPLVGTLLVASAGGAVLLPLVGMFFFSLAFALPFTLLALFPQWLNKLPASGSWLHSVKVVLGFLELALGLKFLSVADQVYHWDLLDREVYLALWITIFSLMGLYLLGKLRLSGADGNEKVGVPRLLLALAAFSFVMYLLPGMFGAPLPALAGYLPPRQAGGVVTAGFPGQSSTAASLSREGSGICDAPLYGDKLHWPHGLQGYFELEQAIACAKEQGKPLFIAFTGHGCVNCREMEARVWSNPRVLQLLKEEYVLLALYVDEKTELPEAEWYRSEVDGRIKKSVGGQHADYQISRFGTNAQPYYVLLDPESGQLLIDPMAYELNPDRFAAFLEQGKRAYRSIRQLGEGIGSPERAAPARGVL
ncbi:protein-disulfide reductase DsbD family protein [Nafulsella turpanensis]|uniref:protein-disulfide reductase DsbD family protein n=1 Tax=Nafulsella turpanensis TaxID=1265690 RepID=UPI000349F0B3|nr:cytochrome c biogenesis protein CcdA [Nafulsella turpanensis]